MSEPKWLQLARAELGVKEISGKSHNERIIQYFRDVKSTVRDDETAWCASFVGAMLERAGVQSTRSLLARSYLKWGVPVTKPQVGDIAVFKRGKSSWQGHVGFYVGETSTHVRVLGGNQGNAVSIASYAKSSLLGYRRPAAIAKMEPSKDLLWAMETINAGPLFFTLAEVALHFGLQLTPNTTADIKARRAKMSDSDTQAVMQKQYWVPSGAHLLPKEHAAFVLHTALQHGANKARLMIQQAAGVEADGVIGEKTVSAIKALKDYDFIDKLIAIRMEDLQKRGSWSENKDQWLKSMTWARNKITGAVEIPAPTMEKIRMTTSKETAPLPKPWHDSLTIWGVIVTFASTVIPSLGQIFGWDVSAGDIQEIGVGVTTALQAIGGVIGSVMAIIGRMRAAQPVKLL